MNARELFDQGDLRGAIDTCNQEVRADPQDAVKRSLLFELLCFAGDLERADKQLDVIAHLDAKTEPAVQVYHNVVFAEGRRRKVLVGESQPEFLLDPPAHVRLRLDAVDRLHHGQTAAAAEALTQAERESPPAPATMNGTACEDVRDCDDVLGPILELIVLRDYIWLPFEQIRELEMIPPERPRDLIWAPVRLVLTDDKQIRGYVPALYDGSHAHEDDSIRLGRLTDWVQAPDQPVRGVGQRTLLAGDNACAILEVRTVAFAPAG